VTALRDEPVAYARAGELNIAYQVLGSGPVDIVYVPGLLNLIEATTEEPACERHFERMTAFARIVIFDKRGTGLSDRVPAEEMAQAAARLEDLRAVMDAVSLRRAALLATADGAIPAILFAARYPERVDALIIVDGTARWMVAKGYDDGFAHDPTPPLEAWGERWGNETAPLFVEALIPSVADDVRWRRVLGRMQRRAGTPRAAYSYWQSAVVKADVRRELAEVRARTLVLHCSGDQIIPLGHGRAIADAVAGAQFVELPGTDHVFWFTNADLVASEVQEFLTGERGSAGGARRLCTVMFTDVVSSTVRAGELGDSQWADLLSSHDRVLRTNLLRYGGRVVKFLGDGVLALFDDPESALQCATAVTSAVRHLGLEIRVGVHSGVVEIRGDDVAGMTVHIAARVMAAASASEVLVTRTVRDLLLGTGPPLAPRGPHELKGVPEPLELFSLERT
jgi:class 3 adenylate cyclase